MFVSGFTIVRNAIKYDYPVVESICSILPLCNEVIVLVGESSDDTLGLIQSIGSEKIKIHHSIWDESLRKGGKVLAVETDKAFKLVNPKSDWCIYIQADELLNDAYYWEIKKAMETHINNPKVEGLLFAYQHFFGNFNYLADSRSYYRNEIRIIKNLPDIQSYRDAQGFRRNDKKLRVKKSGGEVYHYGWVRHPDVMKEKIKDFHQLWHDDEWIASQEKLINDFNYDGIEALIPFNKEHPVCMQERVRNKNWDFKPQIDLSKRSLKKKILYWIEKKTGYRVGEYKNYTLI
jgi:hypothetical protein